MGEAIDINQLPTAAQQRSRDAEQDRRKTDIMAELAKHPFNPPWWLRNRHIQTVGARYIRKVPRPEFRAERWETPDRDFIRVYFHVGDPAKPTALLLHGLEGSVESTYILGLTQELSHHDWNVVAMEFRSCSGEINLAQRMYHSGETEDLAFVVDRLTQKNPNIELYIAGYSLGGNVTAKWFGESGDALPKNVKAGAVVSAPYDLVESGRYMDNTINRVYVLHFLRMLKPKALEKNRQFPGVIDVDKIRRARTFKEFDDHATAPLHGFRDALDYYSSVACGQFLPGVRRPLLLLSAADDPFNPGATLPRELAEKHPYLHPLFTDLGGHVGFVHRDAAGKYAYWAEEQIARFFDAYHARPA